MCNATLSLRGRWGSMRRIAPRLALTLTLALVAGSATADAHQTNRLVTCAEQLNVFKDPARLYLGAVSAGETFGVRRYSASGKYAYGFAYGNANKVGWVLADGLCGAHEPREAHTRSIPRLRVCAERLRVFDRPNRGYLGRLDRNDTFNVRKYSASGKYGYGFAYGNANKVGWASTTGLCTEQVTPMTLDRELINGGGRELRGTAFLRTPLDWRHDNRDGSRTQHFSTPADDGCSARIIASARALATSDSAAEQVARTHRFAVALVGEGRRDGGAWAVVETEPRQDTRQLYAIAPVRIAHNRYVQIRVFAALADNCTDAQVRDGTVPSAVEHLVRTAAVHARIADAS